MCIRDSPNPMQDYILIESEQQIKYLNIFDSSSRLIKTTNLDKLSSVQRINTSDLESGFYLIELVLVNETRISKTLIKI